MRRLGLPHEHQERLQHVARLEAGHHAGHAVVARPETGNMAVPVITLTCPGSRKPLIGVSPSSSSALSGSGIVLCMLSRVKLVSPRGARLEQGGRGGGRGRLEADAGEDHLAVRFGRGDLDRVARRVDHAHVGAGGALGGQRGARRRHAHEVAEGRERYLGQARRAPRRGRGRPSRSRTPGNPGRRPDACPRAAARAARSGRSPWCACRRPP